MALTASSWRRVASTHSLSDLLMDDSKSIDSEDETGNNKSRTTAIRRTKGTKSTKGVEGAVDTIKVRLLGLLLVILGAAGFAASVFVARSCFSSNMKRINDPIQCSDRLLSIFHRVVVEFGLHGVVVPALTGVGHFWVTTVGGSLPLIDRAVLIIKQEFPLGKAAFFEYIEASGKNPSEVVLYCICIVPVLCGPVTMAMIAMNWFSLKIFKHN
jgi:hypothetical protein